MNRINFKLRMLLYFIIVSIFPFMVSWTLIYFTYDEKMQSDFKNFNYMYIQNQISKIDQLFEHQKTELKSIAQAFSFLDPKNSDYNAFLRDQKSVNSYFRSLYIIMPDNTVYSNDVSLEAPEIDYTKLHSYTNAKKAQELVWLEPYTDPIIDIYCIGMSVPLLDNENKESGVLIGNISLKTFEELLVNAKYMPYAEMFVINPSGYVKFHSGGEYYEIVNINDNNFILNPMAEEIQNLDEGYKDFSYLGRDCTCFFSVMNTNGWKVLSLMDTNNLKVTFSTMNKSTNITILLLGLLCILTGLVASLFLSKSITTPLAELREGVKSITAGNLNSKITVNSNDEIREVADAFNEMADNLNRTYTDLLKRTEELYSNNNELHNINIELEASYGQLEATMAQLNESDMRLRHKYDELQTLNRVSTALTSTMDIKTMLVIFVEHLFDITEALNCTIRLISDKDPYKLELKAIKGIRTDAYNIGVVDIREDIIGKAVEKKETYILNLQEEEISHTYYKYLQKDNDAQCVVFTPIIVKSNVIGVICTTLIQMPKDELIELINSLTNSIAIAIDNARAYETLKNSYFKTVQSLVSVVEAKDEYTESHSIRVAKYASLIASEMDYPQDFIEDIWVAGMLHDIGKIGISDSVLKKAGGLTAEEFDLIKQHPEIAYKIVSKIGLGEHILKAIKHHHERFDGNGYPERVKKDEIPIMASIISVADAFDAITSSRPYRESKSMSQGISEIVINKGTQFNPVVVNALERIFHVKQEVFEKIYKDEDISFF